MFYRDFGSGKTGSGVFSDAIQKMFRSNLITEILAVLNKDFSVVQSCGSGSGDASESDPNGEKIGSGSGLIES